MENIHTTTALNLLQAADLFRARLAGEFASIHGLSVNEVFLLLHLDRAERHRLSRAELAKRMHVSASTITRMAAPMEKLGFLGREADARDARLAFVVLTEAGAERAADARTTFAKKAAQLFEDRWEEDDLDRLSSLLGRLLSGAPARLA